MTASAAQAVRQGQDIYAHLARLKAAYTPPPLADRLPVPALPLQPLGRPAKRPAEAAPPPPPLKVSAGLDPYTEALTSAQVAHLFRRIGFGINPDVIKLYTGQQADALIDRIVDAAVAQPLPDPPDWANELPPPPGSSEADYFAFFERNNVWYEDLLQRTVQQMMEGGLRERMMLVWHNHFVTQFEVYALSAFGHRYLTNLRTHALGNFKDFIRDVGLDPAMLIFLDGALNQKFTPNTNYARELLELFTMGILGPGGEANYTEHDIQEIARALTGYWVDWHQLEVHFNRFLHDTGQKTIFGQTGSFDYGGIMRLLFQQRGDAIAHHLCRKLYRAFVYDVPDEAVVAEMASLFIQENFEIAPVVRALLKSAHFFDAQVPGVRIKSPLEMALGMVNEVGLKVEGRQYLVLFYIAHLLDQSFLNPPNVAGWPGHRTWISTSTLPNRWVTSEWILWGAGSEVPAPLVDLAYRVHDANDLHAAFRLPVALAEFLLPVPMERLYIPPVDAGFSGDLANHPIPDDVLNASPAVVNLIKTFLGDIPWYEWHAGHDYAIYVIINYVRYLMALPEYQLT